MKKVLVILGQTATGKTDLALILAKKFNGELISCDSRQVYKGLDIGTGKLPGGRWNVEGGKWKKEKEYWEINGVKIWMYDVVDPKMQYTVKDYVEQAEKVLEGIIKRGKLPIIVGGTGLYLKALLEGLPNLAIPIDERLREELKKLSLEKLQMRLQVLSLTKWKNLKESDQKNPRRLIRAIEIVSTNHTSEESLRATIRGSFKTLKIGLTAPRDYLKKRIFNRLASRLDQGLIEEAEELHKRGLFFKRMKELGLEYGILADLLQQEINKDQFVQILGTKICQYAKRQMTWFKKEKDITWFDIVDKKTLAKVEKRVASWYHSTYD